MLLEIFFQIPLQGVASERNGARRTQPIAANALHTIIAASNEPMDPEQTAKTASEHHRAGRLQEAEQLYRHLLQLDPTHAEALHVLGLIGLQTGRFEEAEQRFRSALSQKPDYPEAHNNLANALYALGRKKEAVLHYRRTLELRPDAAVTYNNLGKALTDLGHFGEAERSFCKALELVPDYPEANNDLGTLFQRAGRSGDAAQCFRRALELNPRFVEAHDNLANALKVLGRADEAEKHYRIVAELAPGSAAAQINLGTLLHERGLSDEARRHFQRAIALEPENVVARWAMAMAQLTVIPRSIAESQQCRSSFAEELARLTTWLDAGRIEKGHAGVGTQRPFYLAYQEENNRPLLSQYGNLCVRAMEHWQHAQGLSMPRSPTGSPLRVGIVSAHIYDHSVWNAIVKGWLKHLDRQRFSLHLFSIDPKHDQETAAARSLVPWFESGSRSLSRWAESILGERLDAILYPEVGMDSVTIQLASMRLAPVQAACWGHPETTGLPTIDYFISADHLELSTSQDCYTERLVKLPNLGICYQPLAATNASIDLRGMGINPDLPLLVCPGTPWKYAPEHDGVFPAIARKLGPCQFIFFRDTPDGLWRKLQERLAGEFLRQGLRLQDHAVFVPWMARSSFYGLLREASVVLDTIGFSGFNTAMQAVECGTPIVAWEGRFMRGRLASAILRRIGLQEAIARSEQSFVDLAVKMVANDAWRGQLRSRLLANRQILLNDMAPIRALENFLTSAIKRA
jgi:predicted O-linked N-acetylglucosamine transferase (SPINDLY family)